MATKKGEGESFFETWYDEHSRAYEDLARSVAASMESLLNDAGIEFVSIAYRLKSKSSAVEKTEEEGVWRSKRDD